MFCRIAAISVISTHALTWRATYLDKQKLLMALFLPTPSHGGRLRMAAKLSIVTADFYPRPHMEGDLTAFWQTALKR